jgi:hypothetical protein
MPLDQETQNRSVCHSHRHDRFVGLGKGGVFGHGSGELSGVQRIANGYRKGTFYGFGGVCMPTGFSPGQILLHAPPPCFSDRLAGVSTRAAYWGAVEEREQVFIYPATKIGFVITTTLNEGANKKGKDKPGLGELAGLESGVISAGLGVGVIVDPFTVVTSKFGKVIIPVRAQCHGITDEGAHDGT